MCSTSNAQHNYDMREQHYTRKETLHAVNNLCEWQTACFQTLSNNVNKMFIIKPSKTCDRDRQNNDSGSDDIHDGDGYEHI